MNTITAGKSFYCLHTIRSNVTCQSSSSIKTKTTDHNDSRECCLKQLPSKGRNFHSVADGNNTFLSPCSSPTATTLSSPLVRRPRQQHFPLPLFVADGNNTFLSPCSSPTATTLSSPLVRRRRQQHFPLPLFVADGTRRGFTVLKTNYSKSNVKLLVVNGASCSP